MRLRNLQQEQPTSDINCSAVNQELIDVGVALFTSYVRVAGVPLRLVQSDIQENNSSNTNPEEDSGNVAERAANMTASRDSLLMTTFSDAYNNFHRGGVSTCLEQDGSLARVTIDGGAILTTQEEYNKTDMAIVWMEIYASCLGCTILPSDSKKLFAQQRVSGESGSVPPLNSSTPCVCDPPLVTDFTPVFLDEIQHSSGVPVENEVSLVSSLELIELDLILPECDSVPIQHRETHVVMYFDGQALSADYDFTPFEIAVAEIYNRINRFQRGLCDPFGRKVESVRASIIDPNVIYPISQEGEGDYSGSLVVVFDMFLTCIGCEGNGAFNASTFGSGNRRLQQQQEPYSHCFCPTGIVAHNDNSKELRGPTLDEFQGELLAVFPELSVAPNGLQKISEYTPLSCEGNGDGTGDLTNLTEVLLVDFVVDCSLVDSDVAYLAAELVNVYNNLNKHSYCDPYLRQMSSAIVLRRGEPSLQDGTLTLEILVTGTCLGCDPHVDGFYHIPAAILFDATTVSINEALNTEVSDIDLNITDTKSTNSSLAPNITFVENNATRRTMADNSKSSNPQRYLADSRQREQCYCPIDAVGSRAPTEAEVMDEFRLFVQEASQEEENLLRCVSSVGECRFGTTFESSLLIAFTDSNSTAEFASDLEVGLQNTLNSLFAPRIGLCRPDFRLVQTVRATLGVSEAAQEELGRRYLGQGEWRRMQEDVSTVDPDGIPSPHPSTMTGFPTFPDTSSWPSFLPLIPPTASPTISTVDSVLVLLSVSGVCNGCSSELLLQNQVIAGIGRKMQQGTDENVFPFSPTTTTQEPESNCFCPIESIVQEGNPSANALLEAFQNQIVASDVPLQATGIQEVQVLDCEDEIEDFATQLELEFLLHPDVSDVELLDVSILIKEAYNDLINNQYCDPLIRRIEELRLDSMEIVGVGKDGCDLYSLTYDVSVACRGCQNASSLFDDNNVSRQLSLAGDSETSPPSPDGLKASQQRRRRLQGSQFCLCERRTVAERAPSLREFENILGLEVGKGDFDMICGLSKRFEEARVTSEPSRMPSEEPSGSPTVCTAPLLAEFQSQIILYMEDGDDLDDETRNLLGEAFQTAYNEQVQSQFSMCDELYREVASTNPIVADRRDRRLRGSTRKEFGHPYVSSRERGFQSHTDGVIIRYEVSGRCDACSTGANFFDILSGMAVLSRVREIVAVFMDANSIIDMGEIDNFACSDSIVEFDEVVIVELVATCLEEDNFGFDDATVLAIEEAFVSTYNMVASQYCDQYFTRLVDAKLQNVGSITVDGNVPIEIRVFAECLGCDPAQKGIYGNSAAIGSQASKAFMDDGNRNLQDVMHQNEIRSLLEEATGLCSCNAQALAKRPPSEAEFIASFRESVEALPLACVSSVGDCRFGSTFDTDIVLSFEGNPTSLNDNVRRSIQDSFLAVLNGFYEPNEEVCNPDFRVILDVAVVFDFTLNGEVIESGANATIGGPSLRKIQESNETNVNSQLMSSNTTALPSTFSNTLPPTQSPTLSGTPLIRTLLAVSGICNGCANELFLSNQVLAGGRALGAGSDRTDDPLDWAYRYLQGGQTETNSNCFCPLTAIVNVIPPSPEQVQGELSRRLGGEEVDLIVTNVDTVSAIACDDESETTEFTSEFNFDFSAFSTIPDLEIDTLGNIIASIYNGLVEDYCDPLIRRGASLQLVDRKRVIASTSKSSRRALQQEEIMPVTDMDSQVDCVNFEATFIVKGLCRGCENGTPLLDADNRAITDTRLLDVRDRILSRVPRTQQMRRRYLENDSDECFCDSSTIAPRAPTLDELWLRLEAELGSFVNVCGQPIECDPAVSVSEFQETTILALQLVRGTVLSEAHLLELEAAYMAAYNRMQNSLRTDKCGGNYRQLSIITADRGILGERRDLEEEADGGGGGRRLSVQSLFLRGIGQCPRECNFGRDIDVLNLILDDIRDVSFVVEVLAVNEYLTGAPSSFPSVQPSTSPSGSPSSTPSSPPSSTPSIAPSSSPSVSPSVAPSQSPSASPSSSPSQSPSTAPSTSPSESPSRSVRSSVGPSDTPSGSVSPSLLSSSTPSLQASVGPTTNPSASALPSVQPSHGPSVSASPSKPPSQTPSRSAIPSNQPSQSPTSSSIPSTTPSKGPSRSGSPSQLPSIEPTSSFLPSLGPSLSPSGSANPSELPSPRPSLSLSPSFQPSTTPSSSTIPSVNPSKGPSISSIPSQLPSVQPSASSVPSDEPSQGPSLSASPSQLPSHRPSLSTLPSSQPSTIPSASSIPSAFPTQAPSISSSPSQHPSLGPTASSLPSMEPSHKPSLSVNPSDVPSLRPSLSAIPSSQPSKKPSESSMPSSVPSKRPSLSNSPSAQPSPLPSKSPFPSLQPSKYPSQSPLPSNGPSTPPSLSVLPSVGPSWSPSKIPTKLPTESPTLSTRPSDSPTVPTYTFPTAPCDPPNNVCSASNNGYMDASGLGTTVADLDGDCKSTTECDLPDPPFYDQCSNAFDPGNSGTFDSSSCVCFPADGSISVDAFTCSSTSSCNCVLPTLPPSGSRVDGYGATGVCIFSESCNFNTGRIGFSGRDTCHFGSQSCNCNSNAIIGAACGQTSCNYNQGTLFSFFGDENPLCGGQDSCNFNNYEGASSEVEIVGSACVSGSNSCNGNRGKISANGAFQVCSASNVCNCNRGEIIADSAPDNVCSSNDNCNNIPECVRISGGCNGPDECNFEYTETCCESSSIDCCALPGVLGTSAANCFDSTV